MRYLLPLLLIAGCGPSRPATLSDGCYEIASSLCDRLSQCGTLTGTIARCRSDGVASCCTGADCSKATNDAAVQFFSDCDAAIRGMSCGQLAAGLQPNACKGK